MYTTQVIKHATRIKCEQEGYKTKLLQRNANQYPTTFCMENDDDVRFSTCLKI
jgi:hypothetical protein